METIPQRLSRYINPGKVFIFSTSNCPYCTQAKKLLSSFEIKYSSVEVDTELRSDKDFINTLKTHSKIDTYPKIYIGIKCIGGYTDLNKLSSNMKLFSMLKAEGVRFADDDQI